MRETLVTAKHLNDEERRWLFQKLWTVSDPAVPAYGRSCGICGAAEGKCVDETCIRTRVTNKLSLATFLRVP